MASCTAGTILRPPSTRIGPRGLASHARAADSVARLRLQQAGGSPRALARTACRSTTQLASSRRRVLARRPAGVPACDRLQMRQRDTPPAPFAGTGGQASPARHRSFASTSRPLCSIAMASSSGRPVACIATGRGRRSGQCRSRPGTNSASPTTRGPRRAMRRRQGRSSLGSGESHAPIHVHDEEAVLCARFERGPLATKLGGRRRGGRSIWSVGQGDSVGAVDARAAQS